ncbi:hypothetical protein BXO88_07255 [Oribacterium sp. C9]|nr:hypothetical protein BXO88_07255 [Oribacterium sp. C9]
MLFLLNLYVAVFFNALVGCVYGIPYHTHLISILTAASYFFSILLFMTIWLYQKQFIEDSVITRVVTVFIFTGVLIYTGAIILNFYTPVLYYVTESGIYSDRLEEHLSIIIDLFCLTSLCAATLLSKLSRTQKLSFLCCILSPVLFSVMSLNMENSIGNYTILGMMILVVMLPICLLFFNANDELEKEVLRREKEQIELQVSAMISQMQPHFLYNSLSVISALCEKDPALASKATDAFSDYLRENINFANKSDPISFSEELSHIKVYVWLEKLRFPNKLNIEYDIKATSFPVPALSVQPLVENAIKHGICKTRSGGTVKISSFETDENYNVTVSDNGAGFDVTKTADDGRHHLGIENTRYRISEMVDGHLDIISSPGNGTTVTIRIPKRKQNSNRCK